MFDDDAMEDCMFGSIVLKVSCRGTKLANLWASVPNYGDKQIKEPKELAKFEIDTCALGERETQCVCQ